MTTCYEHIAVSPGGAATIADTRTKVSQLVAEMMAYGWSAEEIQFQHPFLSLGQIHAALAYYWDHEDQVNREIEAELQFADEMRSRRGQSPLLTRLRAQGLR